MFRHLPLLVQEKIVRNKIESEIDQIKDLDSGQVPSRVSVLKCKTDSEVVDEMTTILNRLTMGNVKQVTDYFLITSYSEEFSII